MSTATIHGLWIDSFTRIYTHSWGFPGSSVGKESTCNVGDPVLIPGSGRSPGKGLGYLLQDSWASLVAQMVKNLPAMQEAWVRSLDWEDPLEEGMATHSSILTWWIRSHGQRSLVGYSPWGCKESDMTEWLSTYMHTADPYQGGGLGCWPSGQLKICT